MQRAQMFRSAKVIAFTAGKSTIWHALRPFHADNAWPMKVLGGPAKGAVLLLDLRINGSYWLGTYDNWILSHIRISEWLPRAGVAWDCGAYTGYYSAIFRRAVGDEGKVIAFEGSTCNFQRLRQVPGLNQWTNVHVIHSAVGPDHTVIDFAGDLDGASKPMGGLFKEHGTSIRRERVVCAGVDELCFERHLPAPNFIKFDLEGAEVFALQNGNRVFSEKRPVILLELHGGKEHPEIITSVGSFLVKHNYLAWDVRSFDQRETEPFTDTSSLKEAVADICNTLVCIPYELSDKRDAVLN